MPSLVLSVALAALLKTSAVLAVPSSLNPNPTCIAIQRVISSSSAVYYPGSAAYASDNEHYMESSSQPSFCSVEPGSVQDVSKIIQVLGDTTTPFGIKGGGHTSNPGFSSTSGVQISMKRLNSVVYYARTPTVDIGPGALWDEVYAALEPFGKNVVGGRVPGIGVAGFTLGGGFSWLSNLHGLTIDTVTGFEIVVPGGAVLTVTEKSYPDLFYGLRGGFNNFARFWGIVTRITLKVYKQGLVWGGVIVHSSDYWPAMIDVIANFNTGPNADPNANLLQSYVGFGGQTFSSLELFYNGPTPPAGIFDDLLAFPFLTKDVKTRKFFNFIQSSPANATFGMKGRYSSISLAAITPAEVEKTVSELIVLNGVTNPSVPGLFISSTIEPFLPSAFNKSPSPSAWPHSTYLSPTNIYWAWPANTTAAEDALVIDALRKSTELLRSTARAEGQDIDSLPIYGNYALAEEDNVQRIYGAELKKLKVLREKWDPNGVMLRAGEWKFDLKGGISHI